MLIAKAEVKTASASRYIRMLCKHFRHKIQVEWDENQGRAEFPMGLGLFQADEQQLLLRCEAVDEEALKTVKYIIEDHLIRFARQEELALNWYSAS